MDTDLTDPLFIDFGSSVNVNDELRRTLQNETIEIDNAIKSLHSSITVEEGTFAQLNKDYSHALSEMFHLSRRAEENQDNAIVKEQIQMRLKECLKEQERFLASPELDDTEEENSDGKNERKGLSKNGLKCISMTMHAQESAAELSSIARSIRTFSEKKAEYMANYADAQCQLDALNSRINREQKNSNTWNQDVAKEMREYSILKEKKNHVLSALQRTRSKLGENTQQYTNQVRFLSFDLYIFNTQEWLTSQLRFSFP